VGESLKIAFIRRKIDAAGGGAEKVAARFIEEFSRRGHRITFFGEEARNFSDRPLPCNWVKVPRRGLAFSPTVRFHGQVQKLLARRQSQFDIIYAMCRTFPADVFRVTEQLHIEWLRRNYSPLARLNPRHRGILKLEKRCFRPDRVRMVVTNSRLVMRQVIDCYDFPADRIRVVPNGVDRDKYYPVSGALEKQALRRALGWPDDKLILLFAAVDFRTKRLDLAINALAGIEERLRRRMVLAVVGGDHPEPFRSQAAELGIETVFPGRASAMRQFYAAADLLYYPSPYEPFANVCLEAASCALPVLTTALNGSSELVEHGRGGYVVDSVEADAQIRAALNDFLELPEAARQEMGRAIQRAGQPYSWKFHADLLEEIFYQIREEKWGLR